MSEVELVLRRTREPTANRAAAWFLAGDDPGQWLAELLSWGADLEDLSLLVVPVSLHDRRPRGVLVVPAVEEVDPSSYSRPWMKRAGVLFHPADAEFDPPVTDEEIREALPFDQALLHPVVGLVDVFSEEMKCATDLIVPIEAGRGGWMDARPGVNLARRLRSVSRRVTVDLADFLGESRDDIGEDELSMLPPAEEEREDDRAAVFDRPRRLLARFLRALTRRMPEGASKPTWVNRLEDWAERALSGAAGRDERRRNREILRLLQMLDLDPDRGLRFAIPCGGEGGRGRTDAGNELIERGTDFDLDRVGAGQGPVSLWESDFDLYERLREQYREAANREIRLGRHRRAAYIFAELLDDLRAAADTLRDGGWHREAAVLYRDRLQMPERAAECLERGGLLLEAIDARLTLGHHEHAGDLWARLGERERAMGAYYWAMQEHLGQERPREASLIAALKRDDPERALAILADAWPSSPQAEDCMATLFELLGKMGRHDGARRMVDRLLAEGDTEERERLARVLAGVGRDYPEPVLRARAIDGARVVVGALLSQATGAGLTRLGDLLRSLNPADRLLRHDSIRFERERGRELEERARRATARVAQMADAEGRRVPVRSIPLSPFRNQWIALAATAEGFFAVGAEQGQNTLNVAQAGWDEASTVVRTEKAGVRGGLKICPPGRPSDAYFVFATLPDAPPTLSLYRMPVVARRVTAEDVALPQGTRVAAIAPRGELRSLRLDGGPTYEMRRADGRLDATCTLRPGEATDELVEALGHEWLGDEELCRGALACDRYFYVWGGPDLYRISGQGEVEMVSVGAEITDATLGVSETGPRLHLAMLEGSAVVDWDHLKPARVLPLASDLECPVIGSSSTGQIVCCAAREARVYEVVNREVRTVTRFRTPAAVMAIAPGPAPDQAAFLTASRIDIYRF